MALTSGAARQKEKTKMQEKVKREDQGMTSQVTKIGFCIRIRLTSARHAVG